MSYPNELWENTRLRQKSYPIQLFRNKAESKLAGECVLYLHWHEHLEWIMIRRGKAIFHIDSRPVEAGPGDMLLLPGGSLHVGYAQADGDVAYDCIVFNASLFNEWVNDPVHARLAVPYLTGLAQFPLIIPAQEAWGDRYRSGLEDIIEELAHKEEGHQLVVKAKLYALFVLLVRHSEHAQPASRKAEPFFANMDRFKLLIDWIGENYAEKLSVRQGAEIVRLDPFHFCKQFKKLTGRTFIEYVNVCRANEAERMLLTTQATVGEIALKVGCENANYFTRMYKQYKGMTPTAARRR
ncbi:AraC family transcriptional regulator [Paenibacillus sp. LHD-117]|uniref:AraC family transcriptional regulator n=1 Tax=Paenibacillus sp. LHD-117 TaxID=3071412 RepID=UPI0027E0B8B2|nr:AraC family transcriptional regulator [Paenibacillus sp. LHD-117]MDQ6420575.1 AraC family transcriptional regulator [Paenibacillus sp. LHD-117]